MHNRRNGLLAFLSLSSESALEGRPRDPEAAGPGL